MPYEAAQAYAAQESKRQERAATQAAPEIPARLDRLHKTVEEIGDQARRLRERLGAVVQQVPEPDQQAQAGEMDGTSCAMAATIAAIDYEARQTLTLLRRTLELLEV